MGPGQLDANGCLQFDTASDDKLIWDLTPVVPNTCGERAERLRFEVVDSDKKTRLGFDEWRLRALVMVQDPSFALETIGLAPGRDVEDMLEDPLVARRVFAGQIDVPMMRLSNAKGVVYWTSPEVELEPVGEGLESVTPLTKRDETLAPGELAVRLQPGASGRIRATLPSGDTLESPMLVAVTQEQAASLDVVLIDGHLIADVRDAKGRPLHAAPIDWNVTQGALGLTVGDLGNHHRTPEYATIETRCERPPETDPEPRRATVRARLGPLEDTVEVEWVASPRPASSWVAPDNCLHGTMPKQPQQGCRCSAAPTTPAAPLALLAAIPLLAAIRRRKRQRK
jgi:MYXO-CTERM domain-containing protein